MKKLAILSAIALSGLIYSSANAQVGVHVGFSFGTRPVYRNAPVVVEESPVVYGDDDDYYYLPDVGAYYNVEERRYYYLDADGDRWIASAYLPGQYRGYDWRGFRRYEVRAQRPYMQDNIYRVRYQGHEPGEWARHYDNRAYNYRNYQRFDNRGWDQRHREYDRGDEHRREHRERDDD
jgi:hypothetical protein